MKSTNLWHGLLFLQGHVADAGLANALSGEPELPRAPSPDPTGVLGHVLYLGGRPMHAGHNFDVEEPFDDLRAAPRIEPLRRSAPPAIEQPLAC